MVSRLACVVSAVVFVSAAPARAQAPTSQALVKQLVTAVSERGLDAIAARDPAAPDRAIAALVYPDSQLLVVAGPFPEPATLDAYLVNRMYRDVYSALQQPSITTGKVFFQDMGCDGLPSGPGAAVDVLWRDGNPYMMFDGNWKKQKLSESAYQQRIKEAETSYSRLLAALVAAAQAIPKTGSIK